MESTLGPLDHTIVTLVMTNASIFVAMISLLLSEMMLLKSMYAWKWSVMAMKDDNLISLIIFNINLLLSGLVTLQVMMLNDKTCNPIYNYMSGNSPVLIPTRICSTSLAL